MSEILSQEEVHALLRGVSEGESDEGADQQTPGVRPCDLTSQERTLYGRMPGLDRVFETFVRTLRSSIESQLGEIGSLTLGGIELLRYGSWVSRITPPVSVTMFRLNPLPGNGLLIMSQPLCGAALEVAFGGKSRRSVSAPGREYSSIEGRVLHRFASRVLSDFQDAWRPVQALDFSIVRQESNPVHAAVATEDAIVLVGELRVLLEADEGLTLDLCIPYGSLDPVRPKLTGEFELAGDEKGASWAGLLRGRISDVRLAVKAELGGRSLSMRDVLALKVGDVLTLETQRDEPVVVHVESMQKFYGVPGIARDARAVRILGRIEQDSNGSKAA